MYVYVFFSLSFPFLQYLRVQWIYSSILLSGDINSAGGMKVWTSFFFVAIKIVYSFFYSLWFTCFHSTLSIISAPGALLSVIGGRSNEIYWKMKNWKIKHFYSWKNGFESHKFYDIYLLSLFILFLSPFFYQSVMYIDTSIYSSLNKYISFESDA